MTNPGQIRQHYHRGELTQAALPSDPLQLFREWWNEVINEHIAEPNAMTLATVDEHMCPSARTVLLKGINGSGFEFFTNYQSHKASDIARNPEVALLFFWKELERQVRVEGRAEKVSRERSEEYFQSRPLGSQIGAWASPQSRVIEDREFLDQEVAKIEERFAGKDPLPVPDHWGGYLVVPRIIEFWQGRPDRLHDRFRFRREGEDWVVERLAP